MSICNPHTPMVRWKAESEELPWISETSSWGAKSGRNEIQVCTDGESEWQKDPIVNRVA